MLPSLCVKDLEENLLNDDQLELAHAPHDWETIALGTSDDVHRTSGVTIELRYGDVAQGFEARE